MKSAKKLVSLVLANALLVSFAVPALAERDGGRKNLDSDGDGYITQEEWEAAEHRGNSKFADIDTDGDGRISEDELNNRKRKEGRERIRERRN